MKIGIQFYNKARKEIEKNPKPFIYELSLTGEQPKQRKFRVLLGHFVRVLKEGMKDQYLDEDDRQNFWDELEVGLSDRLEMTFMTKKVYESRDKKPWIYFALQLHNKQLFQTIQRIVKEMKHLYKQPESKLAGLSKQLECVDFLRTADILVESNYVHDFIKFRQDILEQELIRKKEAEKILNDLVSTVEKTIRQEEEARKAAIKFKEEQQKKQEQEYKQKRQQFLTKGQPSTPESAVKFKGVNPTTNTPFDLMKTPKYYDPLGAKPKHMKNSQYLFLKKYKDELEVFEFEAAPVVSQQREKCYQCERPLSEGFLFLGSNINYCHYTGEWFCNEHFSPERIQIPHKVLNEFDLRGYSVSIRAYSELKSYFTKPILNIDPYSQIVKKNKNLYEFLVLKRQVHLMYDSICEPQLMDKVFQGRINYCLKENYLSLKNMYDIYNGYETPHLQGQYALFYRHFQNCENCLARKGRLCNQCKQPPKIFAFQLREVFSCAQCRKMTHRGCLVNGKCKCETT